MTLDHDVTPPFEVIESHETARDWNLALRRDRIRWPDGTEADYRVVDGPSAVFVVPYAQNGTTVLVRQWRHSWGSTTWEVPAGTLEPGEEPLACAQRELREEAGLDLAAGRDARGRRGRPRVRRHRPSEEQVIDAEVSRLKPSNWK